MARIRVGQEGAVRPRADGLPVGVASALFRRNKARNPSLTPRVSGRSCHTQRVVGGEHGSNKHQMAYMLVDSK